MKSIPCLILAAFASLTTLAAGPTTLRQAAAGKFHIGVALNADQITGRRPDELRLALENFDSVTAENAMKWEAIEVAPGQYDFSVADALVELGQRNNLFIVGHTLVWHHQTPAWLFKDAEGKDVSREVLADRLRAHIRTVVGRYKGKVKGWDVVNEAVDDRGGLRLDKPWYRILGEDALRIAFQTAHEVDPDAELYYNEYSLWEPAKQKTVLELLTKLRAEGLRIDAVGMQEHYMLAGPTAEMVDQTFQSFIKAGFKLMVTELDVSVLPRPDQYVGAEISRRFADDAKLNPYVNGLPATASDELANAYAAYFSVYRKHAAHLKRVTLWGLQDGQSWLNGWPIRGRTDYPLLFDRQNQAKPAFHAVLKELAKP